MKQNVTIPNTNTGAVGMNNNSGSNKSTPTMMVKPKTQSLPYLIAGISLSMMLNLFLLFYGNPQSWNDVPCEVEQHLEDFRMSGSGSGDDVVAVSGRGGGGKNIGGSRSSSSKKKKHRGGGNEGTNKGSSASKRNGNAKSGGGTGSGSSSKNINNNPTSSKRKSSSFTTGSNGGVGGATLQKQRRTTTSSGDGGGSSSSSRDGIPKRRRRRSMTACLLIKDDNALLNEWIAYHYHTLDLRYLVVAVDPNSVTSPTELLDRWRYGVPDDFTIIEWADIDYMPQKFLDLGYYIPPNRINADANASKWHAGDEDPQTVVSDTMSIMNHRYRQLTFLSSCLNHAKANNRTWTLHVDSDEYVTINPFLRKRTKKYGDQVPKSLLEESTIATFLKYVLKHDKFLRTKSNYPCISMPRLLYGNVEDIDHEGVSSYEELVPINIPDPFDPIQFETVRWKYHAAYDDRDRNAQPKVLVDVSQIPAADEMFNVKPFSIHRPSKKLCRRIDQMWFPSAERFPLNVNHYLGTWDRYNARKDSRRSFNMYQYKANVTVDFVNRNRGGGTFSVTTGSASSKTNAATAAMDEKRRRAAEEAGDDLSPGRDTWISSWLEGFVRAHGKEKASKLLMEYVNK